MRPAGCSCSVDVVVGMEAADLPSSEEIETWVSSALDAAHVEGSVEVSVRIVEVDEIRVLNRDYRQRDKATNVLSFPSGDIAGLPDDVPRLLGDIVICADIVAAEALEQGKTLADHWAHMLVHGSLHLLGFDHEDDADAETMESLETTVLAGLGIADPYASKLIQLDK